MKTFISFYRQWWEFIFCRATVTVKKVKKEIFQNREAVREESLLLYCIYIPFPFIIWYWAAASSPSTLLPHPHSPHSSGSQSWLHLRTTSRTLKKYKSRELPPPPPPDKHLNQKLGKSHLTRGVKSRPVLLCFLFCFNLYR